MGRRAETSCERFIAWLDEDDECPKNNEDWWVPFALFGIGVSVLIAFIGNIEIGHINLTNLQTILIWAAVYFICEAIYIKTTNYTKFNDFLFVNIILILLSGFLTIVFIGWAEIILWIIPQISQYIKLIGTICGAIIGFLILKVILWKAFIKKKPKPKKKNKRKPKKVKHE